MKGFGCFTEFQLFSGSLFKTYRGIFIIVQLAICGLAVFSTAGLSSAAIPSAPSNLTATPISISQIRLNWVDNSTDATNFYVERTAAGQTVGGWAGGKVTTYTAYSLTPNITYTFRVKAFNSSGYSAYSNDASATITLTAPSNLSYSTVTYTTATLNWTDSNFESGFSLERRTTPGGTPYTVTVAGNTTTYTSSGLTAGTDYYFRIRAYNGSYSSEYSNELKVTTPVVPAPSDLSSTPVSLTQIRLDWVDNSTDATNFYIERTAAGQTFGTWAGGRVTTYTYPLNTLTPNTTYYFRIRAYNSSGYSAYSNEATGSTMTVNAPSNLSLSSVTYTIATLTWTDNSNLESGFWLERRTSPGGTPYTVNLTKDTTTYASLGLTPGTDYYFRIRAYNGSYSSEYSNELKVTTTAVPPPSDLIATTLTSSQIKLSWTDNSTDETNFYIEKSIDGVIFSLAARATAGTTTYIDAGLAQNTTFYYRVKTVNPSGSSVYSNVANASTLSFNAPSNLRASPLSEKQIKLTWTDNSSDETQFYIQYRVASSETYSDLPPVSTNITTYTHDSASPNTKYYYRVRAYNGNEYSSYSNEADATTPSCVQEGFYQP